MRPRSPPRLQVRLLQEMLQESPWRYYPLTLQFLSSTYAALAAGGPALPPHVCCFTAPMDQLPESLDDDESSSEGSQVRRGHLFGTAVSPQIPLLHATTCLSTRCRLCAIPNDSPRWLKFFTTFLRRVICNTDRRNALDALQEEQGSDDGEDDTIATDDRQPSASAPAGEDTLNEENYAWADAYDLCDDDVYDLPAEALCAVPGASSSAAASAPPEVRPAYDARRAVYKPMQIGFHGGSPLYRIMPATSCAVGVVCNADR